jgi:hypothetical protein
MVQYACGASALPPRYPSKANGIKYKYLCALHLEHFTKLLEKCLLKQKGKDINYEQQTN